MGVKDHRVRERVAQGNTSDVLAWTSGTVVKILRDGIPEHWAEIEAEITKRLYAAGLPVPRTDGVVVVNGRPGIVFERIEGETMWERMVAAPLAVPELMESFVDIQHQVHTESSIDGLPDLVGRVASKIDQTELLSGADRRAARVLLDGLPRGVAVCHGDMHPANVLLAADGIYIVDWFDAANGHPTADYARSSLLLRPPEEPSTAGRHLESATSGFLELVHCTYLRAIVRRGLVEPEAFTDWECVVAVARMCEPVPTDDLLRIWGRWQTREPGSTSEALEGCLADAKRQVAGSRD